MSLSLGGEMEVEALWFPDRLGVGIECDLLLCLLGKDNKVIMKSQDGRSMKYRQFLRKVSKEVSNLDIYTALYVSEKEIFIVLIHDTVEKCVTALTIIP